MRIEKIKRVIFIAAIVIAEIDGKLWTVYSSVFFRNDYTVRITDDSQLDQYTILMLMASFYSDRNADTSN